MKKRELLALKPLPITKKMRAAAGSRKEKKTYDCITINTLAYPWLYRVKKEKDVLTVDVYTADWIMEGIEEPRYRIFFQKDRYDTYDNCSEKWRTATVENLEYDRKSWSRKEYIYSEKKVWIEPKEHQVLRDYLKNEIENPRSAIQVWECGQKHRTEANKIDEEMNIVTEMPKDFKEWVVKEAADQFIFYDAGRKVQEGYCTHCERTVEIKEPRYNKAGRCPHCHHEVIYKSRKKAGQMREEERVGLLQKTREGYVYRVFRYLIRYQNGIREYAQMWETGRMTLDKNMRKRNIFTFGRWKYTNLERWKYDSATWSHYPEAEYSCKKLYWRNLKKVLKGSRLQYSGLDIYAKHVTGIEVEEFIRKFEEYKEKLIKCGFYKLVKATVSYRYGGIDYLNTEAGQCKKVLDLRGDYYKVVAGKNPSVREYYHLHQMQELGIRVTWPDIQYFAEAIPHRNIAIYIRHTTVHRMKRYFHEALEDKQENTQEYHDYLQMAAGLGYDLDDEYVLFPKNLRQRHDLMIEERREKDEEIEKANNKKKDKIYRETVEKNHWKNYEMESEDLIIRLPKEVDEIRKEGHTLHHCVATYIDRVVGGKTCILFIRKKEAPEKSFYTMEVRDGAIIQCRGSSNKDTTEDVQKFVEEFKRKKLRNVYQERKVG